VATVRASGDDDPPVVLDRRTTATGEVVLRRSASGVEVIVDGAFAMSSHLDGRSERRQIELTLAAASRPRSLLIGGLGLGLALARAVAVPTLDAITVVEVEPVIVGWHRTHLRELTGDALEDPRVTVVVGDVLDELARTGPSLDAIALDVDNGPSWLLRPGNVALYRSSSIRQAARRLAPTGAMSVWAPGPVPALAAALTDSFARVEVTELPVPRGPADRVVVATRPHAPAVADGSA
jgi:spermidine synthase